MARLDLSGRWFKSRFDVPANGCRRVVVPGLEAEPVMALTNQAELSHEKENEILQIRVDAGNLRNFILSFPQRLGGLMR